MAAPDGDSVRSPWETHRRRAEGLRERYPFAAEVLTLYLALLDAFQDGWDLAREDRPEPAHLARWAVERVLPGVVKATDSAGPEPLAVATRGLVEAGRLDGSLAGWLAGEELPPVERYLARASLRAPLQALKADADAACAADPSPRAGRRCPRCGGPPQVSVRKPTDDRLVSGSRDLTCARCGQTWNYSSSSCPSCGETSGSRRTVYAEPLGAPVVGRAGDDQAADGVARAGAPTFPHLRIDACATCSRYLIDVDLGRDIRAVPEVDELVALPLDLYAAEHGLSKITPNLMGF
jgi:Protein involved in formate dehydrogenase formation